MQTGRQRPEWAGEVGRTAEKRVRRTSEQPGGGARGARGACWVYLAARRAVGAPGSSPQPPATIAKGRVEPGAPGAGRGRAERIAVRRSPSPTLPKHHSQDNSSAGRRPRVSSAWAGGTRKKNADRVPQLSLGCSRTARRPQDPDGGRRVSVKLRANPGQRWARWLGSRDLAGAAGGRPQAQLSCLQGSW